MPSRAGSDDIRKQPLEGNGDPSARADIATDRDGDSVRLLLVEDNPGDARLLEEYLAETFLATRHVETVGTLEAALDRLRREEARPDVVLVDLDLPDASGLDAVWAAVEAAPGIPVLVLTGRDDRELALSALREGAQDYLLKGEVDPASLARAIRYALERKRAESELARARHKLELLDESLEDVFYLWDVSAETRTLAYCSSAYEEIWGRSVEELLDDPLEFIRGIHPDDRDRVRENLDAKLRGERYEEYRVVHPSGQTRWILDQSYPVRDEQGEIHWVAGVAWDITAQKRLEQRLEKALEELRAEHETLETLFETVGDGLMLTDAEGNFEYANPAAEEILGLEESEIVDRTYRDPEWRICAPDGSDFPEENLPVARVLASGEPIVGIEHGVERPDGSRIVLRVNAAPMRDEEGEMQGVVASIRDVTEQKEFEAQLEHRALHDYLTGLPNRLLFQDRLEQALRRSTRSGSSLAVLFLDLKRFKVINDSLGHEAGDRVLVEIARRLQATVRAQDTVCRFGGDEFTVLLEDVTWKGDAEEVVERVTEAFEPPIELAGNHVTVEASIGVVLHADAEESSPQDPSSLVQRADRAMYRAKEQPGTGYAVAESGGEETAVTRLERESRLREALEAGELETVYHPLYDLATGSLRGVEALARWTDPELGPISPADFIPLAEETGLIAQLGEQQLRTACRAVLEADLDLPEAGRSLRLNVNLSARQLEDPEVVDRIARVLEETGFPPDRLYLEVTESAAMREPGVVERLKALGVGLAVDDFGTRYSTLAQVQRLTVDELKIDRSFVDGLPEDRKDRAIVQTVVTLGNALGLDVVAEGVETAGQLDAVRELGCHAAQGYYFTEPTPRLDAFSLRMSSSLEERRTGRQ